ncbi:vesicle-mediated transport [Tritrichomonas musculus]|uniref:Golgi apparatus membrane protein TVP23 homolog n=1 Tax=Tritrichomonas musculus TaxID=1915356 RepID=A0ABR2K0F7_9EUKA
MDFIQSDQYADSSPPPPPSNTIAKPTGTIFTFFIAFKAAPLFIYLFIWIICPWTIFQWVFTIVSSAIDFWFTKNVAGRLILGMRWSSMVNELGESTWRFEYTPNLPPEREAQRKTFWLILYSSTAIWFLFSFFSLIKLNLGWLFVSSIAFALAITNTWGFMKCDKSIKSDVQHSASSLLANRVLPFLAQNTMNQPQDSQTTV